MDICNLLNHHNDQRPSSARSSPFYCTWDGCHKPFTRRSDLVRHLCIHTGEKPYKCSWPDCSKHFIQRSALTVHMRTHTGERPHLCEYPNCGKSFGDSSSLARHRRTHTGHRPYTCECGKSFTRRTTLVRHRQQVPCHQFNALSLEATSQVSSPSIAGSHGSAYYRYAAASPPMPRQPTIPPRLPSLSSFSTDPSSFATHQVLSSTKNYPHTFFPPSPPYPSKPATHPDSSSSHSCIH